MTLVDEPEASAELAGLDHVSDAEPGLRRVRCGRGFSYRRPDGTVVKDKATLTRIRSLAIPPAWTDVWISMNADGHLQATGRDAKERKQYLYHPLWREVRDEEKYAGLSELAHKLPRLRAATHKTLRLDPGRRSDQPQVLALASAMLDRTLIRIGGVAYAEENDTCGLTTLSGEQVTVRRGSAILDFVGKGGVENHIEVDDEELVPMLDKLRRRARSEQLLSYRSDGGDLVPVDATAVNDHLRAVSGVAITAKDFRTWGGTVSAAAHLLTLPQPADDSEADAQVIEAIDAAAERLGNTRAVCRSSYVSPVVIDAHRTGALADAAAHRRSGRWMARAERAVLDVLKV